MQTTGIQACAVNLSYSERSFSAAAVSRDSQTGTTAVSAYSTQVSEFRLEAQFYSRTEFTGLDDLAYWGVEKTAERLANFVLNGGGDNLDRLRAGREGIIRGFKEAEQIWGGQLPEISYQTLDKALEAIDQRIHELNGSVIDRLV